MAITVSHGPDSADLTTYVDASKWTVEDGILHVYGDNGSAGSFAPGHWASVSKTA